jgi:hypothetical protein
VEFRIDFTIKAAEMENGKHRRVEYNLRCKAALPLLEHPVNELEKNVGQQTSKELETLLWWKGVPMSKWGTLQTDASCTNNFQREA